MDGLRGVRVVGPLAPYAGGLVAELARLGFTEGSARCQLGLAAHLSRWLEAAGLGTEALTAPTVEAYLAARRSGRYHRVPDAEGSGPAAGVPAAPGRGTAARAVPAPATWVEALLEAYRAWLLGERG